MGSCNGAGGGRGGPVSPADHLAGANSTDLPSASDEALGGHWDVAIHRCRRPCRRPAASAGRTSGAAAFGWEVPMDLHLASHLAEEPEAEPCPNLRVRQERASALRALPESIRAPRGATTACGATPKQRITGPTVAPAGSALRPVSSITYGDGGEDPRSAGGGDDGGVPAACWDPSRLPGLRRPALASTSSLLRRMRPSPRWDRLQHGSQHG